MARILDVVARGVAIPGRQRAPGCAHGRARRQGRRRRGHLGDRRLGQGRALPQRRQGLAQQRARCGGVARLRPRPVARDLGRLGQQQVRYTIEAPVGIRRRQDQPQSGEGAA